MGDGVGDVRGVSDDAGGTDADAGAAGADASGGDKPSRGGVTDEILRDCDRTRDPTVDSGAFGENGGEIHRWRAGGEMELVDESGKVAQSSARVRFEI